MKLNIQKNADLLEKLNFTKKVKSQLFDFKDDQAFYKQKLFSNAASLNNENTPFPYYTSTHRSWVENRALVIVKLLIKEGLPEKKAFIIVAQSAIESGYYPPINNNIFGIGGVVSIPFKSINACLEYFKNLLFNKYPTYLNQLKSLNDIDSDTINWALNSGPYIKPNNWFHDSLLSYNTDLDNTEPLKLKTIIQDKQLVDYPGFPGVPKRIISGTLDYGRNLLNTYKTVMGIMLAYNNEKCNELTKKKHPLLKELDILENIKNKSSQILLKIARLRSEIKIIEAEEIELGLQFRQYRKNYLVTRSLSKKSSRKINQSDTFAYYKNEILEL